MMWALPLGMAALGAIEGQNQANRDRQWNEGQAEVSRYSPWTKMKPEFKSSTSSGLNGAMQGGFTGLAMGQAFSSPSATGAPSGPTAMSQMGSANGAMMDAGRMDKMQGIGDSSLSDGPFGKQSPYQFMSSAKPGGSYFG